MQPRTRGRGTRRAGGPLWPSAPRWAGSAAAQRLRRRTCRPCPPWRVRQSRPARRRESMAFLTTPHRLRATCKRNFHRYYHGLDRPQDFRLLTGGELLYIGVTAAEPAIAENATENVSIFIAPRKDSDQFLSFSVTMDSQGTMRRTPDDEQRWTTAFRQHATSGCWRLPFGPLPSSWSRWPKGRFLISTSAAPGRRSMARGRRSTSTSSGRTPAPVPAPDLA